MAAYIIQPGDTLCDVCLNTTGSLRAIDEIMDLNSMVYYAGEITDRKVLVVPNVTYNSAAVQSANKRPFNNSAVSQGELASMLAELRNKL